MKDQWVTTLAEGVSVDSTFAVASRDLRAARTGDAYLALELSDRSGRIAGVKFRPRPEEWSVPVGSVVRVRGRVTSFRGAKRISVEALRAVADYDREDMVAAGPRDAAELLSAFETLRAGVADPALAAVLRAVFGDPGTMERFARCPGAQHRHHAYRGGLLEHSVSVASMCRMLAPRYDAVDVDLLVTAALLHDVGKIDELTCDTSVEMTEAGRLLGHVVLGERIVSHAIERVGSAIDAALAARLLHLVASHHGRREWGAPVEPCLIEAVILHHADDLDAQAAAFLDAVAGAAVLEQSWTNDGNAFGRSLYVPAERPARAPGPRSGRCDAVA